MRIIAGKWRGRTLLSPPAGATRPILDQVKGALFNILGAQLALPGRLPPCGVLDLFCGTGTLGLEALSRGARRCVFVEKDRGAVRGLRENIAALGAAAESVVLQADLWKASVPMLLPAEAFDLVFVDPPYADADTRQPGCRVPGLIEALVAGGRVAPEGLIILRQPRQAACTNEIFTGVTLADQRTYGSMILSLLRVAAPSGGA
jgi:16S rRNA (guanine966-N2)-methyltransferase